MNRSALSATSTLSATPTSSSPSCICRAYVELAVRCTKTMTPSSYSLQRVSQAISLNPVAVVAPKAARLLAPALALVHSSARPTTSGTQLIVDHGFSLHRKTGDSSS